MLHGPERSTGNRQCILMLTEGLAVVFAAYRKTALHHVSFTMVKVTAPYKGSYYLYAIKPLHATFVKIGFYLADMRELHNRYVTPYGASMDVCVFELPDKKSAMAAEKSVHAALKKAGHHIEGELFHPACMPLFLDTASALCAKTVTVAVSRNTLARKRAAEDRSAEREWDRNAKRQHLTEQRQQHIESVHNVIEQILADKDHPLHVKGHVNAADFRQQVIQQLGDSVRQEDLKIIMSSHRCLYARIKRNGVTLRVFNKSIKPTQ